MRWMRRVMAALLLLPMSSAAQEACADSERYRALDFWLGEWDVLAGGQRVGSNRIERILDGCAMLEHWADARGGEGKSLFYVDPGGIWRQVWVTSRARAPGGTKEKRLVARLPGGGVRFEGEVPLEDGGSYLDRTTLTPNDDGSVRQVIETSGDGGVTWQTRFDALYVRRATSPDGGRPPSRDRSR